MPEMKTLPVVRLSPAQLEQITTRAAQRAVRAERQRIAEEIAGRAVVERSLNDDPGPYIADVLDEIAQTIASTGIMEPAPRDAERQPSRRDVSVRDMPAQVLSDMATVAMRESSGSVSGDEVPIGPPKRVPLTQEQVNREAAKLLVPGMESLPFPGYDAGLEGDGLPPHVERSDEDDVHRLVR